MLPTCFLFFCLFTPPVPSIPDGQGGFVPYTNSRVMPDGSLRPYDPALDGYPPGYGPPQYAPPPEYLPPGTYVTPMPQGRVDVGPPEPYQPSPMPPPQPHRHATKPVHRAPENGAGCYGDDGRPVEPVPPECAPQPPLPSQGNPV